MTRSNAREIAVRLTFEVGFSDRTADELLDRELARERFERLEEEDPLYRDFPSAGQRAYITELVRGVYAHSAELDSYIEKYAVGWKFSRISRVAAAVMRVTMFEILYMPDIPNRAAINEAVEITRKYEDEEIVRFVNGILGSFVRAEFPESNAGSGGELPAEAPEETGEADPEAR